MHPILFHLGHIAITTEGLLIALGLLAGLQLTCWVGARLGLDSDRLWNLGLVTLLTLFLGERLLIIAFHSGDFISHPFWMLGLVQVRDERYFWGGAVLAICAGSGYIIAWGLPWRRVADALAPGSGLSLACTSLGAFAAGANFGRPTSARWGVVYTSHLAASATPVGIPLVPVMLYAAVLHLALAGCAASLAWRGRPGAAAAFWLFTDGLGTILLGQLRYRLPGEPLVFSLFTPAQTFGIAGVALAALFYVDQTQPR